MKAVLLSIQPKWVEKIASGSKTIEVRKSRPKIETPFKCYIYCTYGNMEENYGLGKRGKVIGEFICDRIYGIKPHDDGYGANSYTFVGHYGEDGSCLTFKQLDNYLKNKIGFGWHISNLKIYDKPKELSEFNITRKCKGNKICDEYRDTCPFGLECERRLPLTRPPQSWCYVEELSIGEEKCE